MPSGGDSTHHGRRSRAPRFTHRSQSHAHAHANSPAASSAHVRHPLVSHDPPLLVTTQDKLLEVLADLRASGSFAYDSEFIGELTYIPRLCLIQAASSKCVALIDPLAALDLTPFWELVADPWVEKIVHAGQQDVEPVFRAINKSPANLIDTQAAAGFIGMGYPLSLSKLVMALVGAKLGKGLTFTQWDHRPLSDSQLRYAADDVRFLPAVRHEIGARLNELGHTAWAAEESNALTDPALYVFDPDGQYMKIRGASSLPPSGLAVLRELARWRDRAARQEDVPPRSMLKDEILLDLARSPIHSIDQLPRVRGLPRPVEANYGQAIVDATKQALALPIDQLPAERNHEPPPAEKFRADALFFAAQCICAGQQIDPNLVTSRQEIGELYRCAVNDQAIPDLRVLRGWRKAAVGDSLLLLLNGQLGLSARWTAGALHTDVKRI